MADIYWCTFSMMILTIIPSIDYNKWLKRLDSKLNEQSNKNSFKVPKVVEPTSKKLL